MFTLIDLPYPLDALEPVISARTLEFHHGKHLQGYVDNLNKLIAGTEFEAMRLEEIVISSAPPVISSEVEKSKAIFNNAGQILNHNLYFTQFRPVPEPAKGPASVPAERPTLSPHSGLASSPHSGLDPESPFGKQIAAQWSTLEAFQTAFVTAGTTLFGSGWVWLSAAPDGALSIGKYPGADNPVAHGLKPLLTFDVWEHAYYLDYQNRRPDHLKALWAIVDWGVVEERYGQ